MKIILAYPPLEAIKGTPLISQNRQYQVFSDKTVIYPVVPAQAATLLKQAGYEVIWLDCIAEGISYDKFLRIVQEQKPDLIAIETKTPVVREHWRIIDDIKKQMQGTPPYRNGGYPAFCRSVPVMVLFGDHVTALPEEAFQNSKVDFVLTGGDYDFLLLNLCNYLKQILKGQSPVEYPGDSLQRESKSSVEAVPEFSGGCPREVLEPGIYYRENEQVRNTGKFELNHNLDSLPFIDRDLTKWPLYSQKNGNYKRTPGTYIMSGRDCWWGKCSFCSWTTIYSKFRVRSVNNVLDEIGMLIDKYKVREIMDDTGCFPSGGWLREFCQGMIERGYNKKIYLDCNMRFGALTNEDLVLMKKANFRLLLFGLESSAQATLDRINKNLKVERITQDCKLAAKAGLYPHITIMFGYPWESHEDALNTLKLGSWLLKKGYAYTMQATMVIPYPGTPLFEECKNKGWLKTMDWEDYDMKQPVMKSPIPDDKIMELVQSMYRIPFQPEFILRKLFSIRDADDLKYYSRAARKVFGHIFDFTRRRNSDCNGK